MTAKPWGSASPATSRSRRVAPAPPRPPRSGPRPRARGCPGRPPAAPAARWTARPRAHRPGRAAAEPPASPASRRPSCGLPGMPTTNRVRWFSNRGPPPAASAGPGGPRPCPQWTSRRAGPGSPAGGPPGRAACHRRCTRRPRSPGPCGSRRPGPTNVSSIGPSGSKPGTASAPRRRSQAGSCGPRESRTFPAPGGPDVSSSSPNITRPIPTGGVTRNVSCPAAAARPMTAGVTGVPAGSSSSPRSASSPGSRHSGVTAASPRTRPSGSGSASSSRMMVSVCSGTIAPVAIFTAVPSWSGRGIEPANT